MSIKSQSSNNSLKSIVELNQDSPWQSTESIASIPRSLIFLFLLLDASSLTSTYSSSKFVSPTCGVLMSLPSTLGSIFIKYGDTQSSLSIMADEQSLLQSKWLQGAIIDERKIINTKNHFCHVLQLLHEHEIIISYFLKLH